MVLSSKRIVGIEPILFPRQVLVEIMKTEDEVRISCGQNATQEELKLLREDTACKAEVRNSADRVNSCLLVSAARIGFWGVPLTESSSIVSGSINGALVSVTEFEGMIDVLCCEMSDVNVVRSACSRSMHHYVSRGRCRATPTVQARGIIDSPLTSRML